MDVQPEIPNQPTPHHLYRRGGRYWFRQLFSEDNGDDPCVAKIMATVAFISYVAYAGVGLYQGHFGLTDFGTGLMTVLFGSAGIISGKNFSTHQ